MKRKLFFLVLILLTYTVLMVNTNTVGASTKGKITKVTITKPANTKLKLAQNSTYQLKTSLKGTATNKKLTYKTSNKNIVSVSKNGKVKALKIGNSKITVSSKINKAKKDTIKVTVYNNSDNTNTNTTDTSNTNNTDVINLVDLKVLATNYVQVKLSSAKKLTASDFTVNSLFHSIKGNAKIDNITTKDSITYNIYLNSYYDLVSGNNVTVTIPSLDGTQTKEIQYKPAIYTFSTNNVIGIVGNTIGGVSVRNAIGKITNTLKSGSLPKGITLNQNNTYISFSGTPTEVVDGLQAVITATDESGNCIDVPVTFYIGDSTHIVCPVDSITRISGELPSHKIQAYGGSDNYIFEPVSLPSGVTFVDFNILDYFYLYGNVSSNGECKVKITDANDSSISKIVTIPIIINTGYKVQGTVKDVNGNVLANQTIFLENNNTLEEYQVTTDQNGNFTAKVLPGYYSGIVNGQVVPGHSGLYKSGLTINSVQLADFTISSGDYDLGEILCNK